MKENMRKRVNNLEENRQEIKKDLKVDLSALSEDELRLLEKVALEKERLVNEEGYSQEKAIGEALKDLSKEEEKIFEEAGEKITYK